MDVEDENDTPKPRLNRRVLERHGITYSEEARVDQALLGLPEHVALLAEFLLDFEGLLEISSRPVLENELRNQTGNATTPHTYGPPAESTYFQTHDVNTRRSERNKAIDEAELKQKSLIAGGARWLEENQKSEDDWVFYLRVNIFKAFEQHQDTSSEPSRYGKLFDRWSMEQNNLWDGFRDRNLDSGIRQPTLPKPDLTFAYPIIEHKPETSKGLWRDESAKNFTVDTLCALWNDGRLRSSPKASLARLERHGNKAGKLVCFPWAVVEIKPAVQQSTQFCYCQAANGASCALEIYEGLIRRATGKLDDDFPLVIAFTTVGPRYKVWLSYSSSKERGRNCHTMVCIWEHSMGTTWGLIALQHIVQNMQLWAFRVLRPRVSHYISQCRKRNAQDSSTDDDPSDPPDLPSRSGPAVPPETSETSEPPGPSDAPGGSEPRESSKLPDLPDAPDSSYKPPQTSKSSETSGLVAVPELSETSKPAEAPELLEASEPAVTSSGHRSSPSIRDPHPPVAERMPISDDLTALPTFRSQFGVETPLPMHNLPSGSSTSPNRPIRIPRGRLARFTLNGVSVRTQTDVGKAPSTAIPAGSSFRADVRSISANAQLTNPGTDEFELQSPVRPTSAPLVATGEESSLREHSDLENQHSPPPSSEGRSPRSEAAVTSQAYRSEDSTTQSYSESDCLDDPSYVPSEADSEHSGNTSRATWETQSQDPSTADEAEHDIESRPYHVYRLGDHDTRLDIAELSDTESDEPDDLSYVPSDTSSEESDSQSSAAPEAVSEANLLTREVIDGLETRALGALSGAQFVGLDSVKCRINCLKGSRLLDAIWRALERVLEPGSRSDPHILQDILNDLSHTLSLTSDELLTAKDVMAGRKWELIDEALQEMQKASEFRSVIMLCKALSLWSGDICLEILKPNLSDLLSDEWASIKHEALVILMDERGPNDQWEEKQGNGRTRAAKPESWTVSTEVIP